MFWISFDKLFCYPGEGQNPILDRPCDWNSRPMRHKEGNGHTVDLPKFMEDIKTVVEDGEQLLKAGVSEVKGKALSSAKSTNKLVRSHPYQTLCIVLGVGLIVGLIATGAFSAGSDEEEED